MGHRISRPANLSTTESKILLFRRGLYVAVAVTLLATVASSSPCDSTVASTLSHVYSTRSSYAQKNSLSRFSTTTCDYHHSSRQRYKTLHYDFSSSLLPSCFVSAAPNLHTTINVKNLLRTPTHDALRLCASATLTSPPTTSGFFAPISEKFKRREAPSSFPIKARNAIQKDRGNNRGKGPSGLHGSSLSIDYGSSSRWEPLRVRQYNEVARRKKRQQHLLKIVRDQRHDKGSAKLHYKDEGVLHNEVCSPPDDLLTFDFPHVATHQPMRHRKKCLVLRKDRHGKIRTFWTKVPVDVDDTASTSHDHDNIQDLSVCSPRDQKCAVHFGTEVVEAKIPKPAIRKSEAEMYAATDVSTLRKIFGRNKNRVWGDLDPETTRILYHTLLPRALLRLHAQGLAPDELAPLAYEARCAAKQYARERCQVPGRVASMAFDGLRHVKEYGKWSSKGLSWDQIWEKYEQQVLKDLMNSYENGEESTSVVAASKVKELTTQVCMKILERSCSTNGLVDRVVMGNGLIGTDGKRRSSTAQEVLAIANKFDQEIHELLNRKESDNEVSIKEKEFRLMRTAVSIRRKLAGLPFYFSQMD